MIFLEKWEDKMIILYVFLRMLYFGKSELDILNVLDLYFVWKDFNEFEIRFLFFLCDDSM